MQLSMVGIMSSEINLLMSSSTEQAQCWYLMGSSFNLFRIKVMKKYNFGMKKENLG